MKTIISFLILIASLCFACAPQRETSVRPLVAETKFVNSAPDSPLAAPTAPPNSNTATVISLHANLRAEDKAGAAVLEVVPQDTSVEVIKQQGAWFLVKTDTNRQGWLHGNTIKLQSYTIPATTKIKPAPVTPKPSEEISDTVDAPETYKSSSKEYVTGPRGGCYYINSNGNKTYVDRSMCGSGEPVYSKPAISSSNGYTRGPRGGCYYITGSGRKQYVDRTLCN